MNRALNNLPKRPKFTQVKRAVISELLSIAQLSGDIATHEVITARLNNLMSGSRPWLLSDESIRDLLTELIRRFDAVEPVVPSAKNLANAEGEEGLHLL